MVRVGSCIGRTFHALASSTYGAIEALSKPVIAALLLAAPATAEPVTVLAFGDSLTAGYGLEYEQGFAPQLEAWLTEHGTEASVVNAGLSGDTTGGGASRIDWSLTDEVDAVILALGGNDLLRGIPPDQTRANLDAILTAISARNLPVLLIGQRAIGNYGSEYAEAFDALYPALAAAYGAALYPNFLQALENLGDRDLVLQDYMQRDALHPNAAGVALIVAEIGPEVVSLIARTE